MAHEAFLDDAKDAGEIGAGHHVTALYEIVPAAEQAKTLAVSATRSFGKTAQEPGHGPQSFTVKLRYKQPEGDTSRQFDQPAVDSGTDFGRASDDLKFAAAVAGFGMLLRDSPYKGTLTYAGLKEIAPPATDKDPSGYRKEFLDLVDKAKSLTSRP